MYAEYPIGDFLQASRPDILKADNQNSYFSMSELESIYGVAQIYLKSGLLIPARLDNSFCNNPRQSIISFNYAPMGGKPPRLAFLIQKTIFDDAVPDYQAQFNIHTEQGWLQTTRMQSINLPVILAGLRDCIHTKWDQSKAPLSLIHG